ncbi:hypothetical protein A1D23_05060 [Chelonobacter oris]|nr:DUF1007 family protein [Chelonobacter oris]MDH2999467.1 hypothetical protein [Chelonobacter oris]
MRKVRLWCLGCMAWLLTWQANAHPHAFIEMQTEFLIEQNRLIGFRMSWLFDPAASAEIIYDLNRAKDSAQTRRRMTGEIMQNIVNQHYFSYFYDKNRQPLRYSTKPDSDELRIQGDRLWFSFRFYLAEPQPLAGFEGSLSTYDPGYYVAMYYPSPMNGTLPEYPQCKISVYTPKIDDFLKNYAESLDKSQRDEDLTLGSQFAQQVKLTCR